MHVDKDLVRRRGPIFVRGGDHVVARADAPLGRHLVDRPRVAERPPSNNRARQASETDWSVHFRGHALGDMLLALGLVRGLNELFGARGGLKYVGPHAVLMRRCAIPMQVESSDDEHYVATCGESTQRVVYEAVPERDPLWLEPLDDRLVRVHASLPQRYALWLEQLTGRSLSTAGAPLPSFPSSVELRPFHVVIVTATSWPARKDYGIARYLKVIECFRSRIVAPWTFTVVTGEDETTEPSRANDVVVLRGAPAAECVDLFASADLVLGNDTGLMHLAALVERSDGTSPQVVSVYGRHAYNKWTTGRSNHHGIATPFSHMLSHADRCPVRDQLDDALWGAASDLAEVSPEWVAEVVGRQMGWWS